MLSPYRVLDLTNERGQLCGQILGDLGADVSWSNRPEVRAHSVVPSTKMSRIPVARFTFRIIDSFDDRSNHSVAGAQVFGFPFGKTGLG